MAIEFTPHEYQKEALKHLCSVRRAALWMPMGGGKSVTTLTALEALSTVEEVYPALVLAPLRVARSTWPAEVKKWAHLQHLTVSPITGTAKQRERALAKPADIYTTNYDNLKWLCDTLGDDWPFKTVVADEFTRLKSFRLRQGGSRARALGKVAHTHVSRFIGLTGTPAPNGVKDLWGQIWFLDKGERLGQSFAAFEMRWFRKGYDGYSLVPYEHTQSEIEERLRDICLTVRGLQVDEPIEHVIYVDLPAPARALYNSMEREMFAALEVEGIGSVDVEASNAATKVNKCRQIANGFLFTEEGVWEAIHDEKLKALESVVEEANGMPVLTSYTYVPDRERIRKHFRTARVLDADPDTITQWNEGRIPLLLAHPASAGHGLNLQDGGNILADFGVDWNLEHDMQIIERIGPLRQKQAGYDRPVFRYRIIARDTIEEWGVLPRLQSKRSVQEILIEAMERRKKK